ncbi:MAG: hypothetical protein SPJ28_05935 [Oscillospiraceae bacterium]|nr:hypothetical protein [Oscillospiraceae bacterium]
MNAIIYTTNAGSTERYARLLAQERSPAGVRAGRVLLCGGAVLKIVTMEIARILL